MKQMRKIIKIDEELCDGCGLCVPDCAEGSLRIINGKAKLMADKLCDGLGACLGSCPTGALTIEEREADHFDEEAVEEFLSTEKKGGCPSAAVHSFAPVQGQQQASEPEDRSAMQKAMKEGVSFTGDDSESLISHWPIQLRLTPPSAPFLKGADLLVAADCTAVAAGNFQQKYLAGKAVVMSCPKFDDQNLQVEKFTQIFSEAKLRSITILLMEVPCCSSMNRLIKTALERSGVEIPVEQVIISLQGKELSREKWRKEAVLPLVNMG